MGRLLDYQKIESGQVIPKDVFRNARTLFTEMSEDLVEKRIIYGALVYGSVAIDTMGPRSDFDAVTSLLEESVKSRLAVRAIKLEMHRQFGDEFVGIFDNTVKPQRNFESGNHDFSRFLGQHLSSDDRIVIGNDFAANTRWAGNEKPASEHLREYLANKERRLSKTYEEIDPLDLSHGGLQRMLELPCAIGRRALQVTAEIEGSPEPPTRSVDKNLVTAKARSLFERYGLDYGFDALVTADQNYNKVLDDAIKGKISQTEYEDFICELHAQLPNAIGWINDIFKRLPVLSE